MAFFDFLKPNSTCQTWISKNQKGSTFQKDLKAMESKLHDCIAKGSCLRSLS